MVALGIDLKGKKRIVGFWQEATENHEICEKLLADAKKREWGVTPISGDELEAIAREVIVQPADVIERMKKILEK